jgi:hypothetical protein
VLKRALLLIIRLQEGKQNGIMEQDF